MLYSGYVLLVDPVRVLHGRADQPQARRRAGSGRRATSRWSPGRSWGSGCCSARAGPTRSSAGAATGAGTRWRTRRSCPGWSAPAFLHSVMVQEKRGMLKVWNVSLISATFCLCLLGTFLVRSGILQSIHAFGASTVGGPLLGLIAVTAVGATVADRDPARRPASPSGGSTRCSRASRSSWSTTCCWSDSRW